MLGLAILAAGIWFIIWRGKRKSGALLDRMPAKSGARDCLIGFLGGLSGGFVGINSPIFILYFGSHLAKGPKRRLLVLILLPSAFIQVVTYSAVSLMSRQIWLYALMALPGLLLGIYIGNRTFFKISEKIFGVALGGILILLSWGLLL